MVQYIWRNNCPKWRFVISFRSLIQKTQRFWAPAAGCSLDTRDPEVHIAQRCLHPAQGIRFRIARSDAWIVQMESNGYAWGFSKWWYPKSPVVSIPKWTNFGCFGGTTIFGILHVSMHKQLLCGQLVEFTIAESCWDSDVEICPNDFPWYQFWLSNQLWHVQPNSLQCMFSGIIYDEWNLQPLKHIETMSLALQKRDASSRWGVTPLTTATALASDQKHSPWSCDGGTRCMSQVNFESLYEMIIWLPSASDKPLVFLSTCFKRRTGNIAVYFMIPTFGPCVFQYLLTCSNVVAVLVVVYSWIWVRCAATALAMIYLTTVPGKKEQEAIRNAISTFFEDKASWEPNDLQANLSQPREISALLFVLHDFHVVVCKI